VKRIKATDAPVRDFAVLQVDIHQVAQSCNLPKSFVAKIAILAEYDDSFTSVRNCIVNALFAPWIVEKVLRPMSLCNFIFEEEHSASFVDCRQSCALSLLEAVQICYAATCKRDGESEREQVPKVELRPPTSPKTTHVLYNCTF